MSHPSTLADATHNVALELREIGKKFSGVSALDGVSLKIGQGEVHAICGENGAGKSTLMKIIGGLYPVGSYSGDLLIGGQKQSFQSIRDSQRAGIAIVFQELSLVRSLSVAENIFLGREPSSMGIVDRTSMRSRSKNLLTDLGLGVDSDLLVEELGIGQQQLVEIAKAMVIDAKVLILDEPTSALSEHEIEVLMRMIRKLRERGVSVLLITHKLAEVFAVADRITILRDGRRITTYPVSHVTEEQVIADMVGRELTDLYPAVERGIGDTVFEVRNLTLTHPVNSNTELLSHVSFHVKQGEILGISGLMGSGRTELLMAIFGSMGPWQTGEMLLHGRPVVIDNPMKAIRNGLALVSEDRKRLGLLLEDNVAKNISLAHLSHLSKGGVIDEQQESKIAHEFIRELKIKTPSVEFRVGHLSGGNQQKVVLAKWMLTQPKILFLDEPTRGIDVGARAEIYRVIGQLAKQGVAIVMVSSELPEVLGLSDRILVMCEGRITGEFQRNCADQQKIMKAATMFSKKH